jgi:hypothetical protein
MCGLAAGKPCVLAAGGSRNGPRGNRKAAAAEAVEKKRTKKAIRFWRNMPKGKKPDAAFLGLVARLKKILATPQLTKSVREKATKRQVASWTRVS